MPHPDSSAGTAQKTRQAPNLPWRRVGAVAALVFALSLSAIEATWRSQGYCPTVPESLELWHYWRERARSAHGNVVAILGTSRVLADISLATMSQCLPSRRIVQLGISGSISPVKIFDDLLDDPEFVGTVICELDTPLLDRTFGGGHEPYLSYRRPAFPAYTEVILRDLLDDRLVSLRSPFTLRSALMRVCGNRREFQEVEPRQTFRREWQFDFSDLAKVESLRRNTTAEFESRYKQHHFPTWIDLRSQAEELNAAVKRFQARGGQVVFLRAPSSGERWRLEEHYHAKKDHWDRFSASSDAICIHFLDVPAMRNLECPDDSHLDFHDTPSFTRALVEELTRRARR